MADAAASALAGYITTPAPTPESAAVRTGSALASPGKVLHLGLQILAPALRRLLLHENKTESEDPDCVLTGQITLSPDRQSGLFRSQIVERATVRLITRLLPRPRPLALQRILVGVTPECG